MKGVSDLDRLLKPSDVPLESAFLCFQADQGEVCRFCLSLSLLSVDRLQSRPFIVQLVFCSLAITETRLPIFITRNQLLLLPDLTFKLVEKILILFQLCCLYFNAKKFFSQAAFFHDD